jgi:hypothetical protein
VANHAAKMIFMLTPGGTESVIADHALPTVPGQEVPPIDEDQIARFAIMNQLAKTIPLPDLS